MKFCGVTQMTHPTLNNEPTRNKCHQTCSNFTQNNNKISCMTLVGVLGLRAPYPCMYWA